MKSIKKLKKYGTAIAGSALLVGATLTGAAAANHGGSSGMTGDLSDYPHPFVDEDGNVQSSIVVGEDAATADVVGAIDIAGSLSQAAFTSEEIEGGSTASDVDGESLDEEVIDEAVSTTSIDASDASFFVRETVQDDDDDDVFVSESATISPTGGSPGDVVSRINGTTTDLNVEKDSVQYSVAYSPGFAVNDTLQMLGQEFELTGFDGSVVELGSTEEATGLAVGGSYSHGPYTVNVEGGNSDNGDILVNVMEDGNQVESGQLSQGETLDVDDDFDVTAETAFYSSGSESWSIALESTRTDTEIEQGEDVPVDDDYVVESITRTNLNGDEHVTGITLRNDFASTEDPEDEDEIAYLDPGESVEGPAGYFEVQSDGLTSESMSEVEFSSEQEVTFMDPNAQEQTVDFAEHVTNGADVGEDDQMAIEGDDKGNDNEADHYFAEVTSVQSSSTEVTVEHADFSKDFAASDATTVDVTANDYTAADGNDLTDASNIGTGDEVDVHYQRVSTGYGFDVVVEWIDSTAGSSVTVEEVNVYGGDYSAPSDANPGSTGENAGDNAAAAAGTHFTVQGGAEVYLAADNYVTSDGTSGGTDLGILDGTDGGNNDYIALSEAEGDDDNSGTANEVHVWYEDSNQDTFDDADDGEIGGIYTGNPGDSYGDVEDGEEGLSKFGTALELDSGSSAVLHYPDEERYQQVAFGDVGASSGGDTGGDSAMSMSPTYGDTFPTTGALDTDERVGQVKENDNVIVVGGPAINDLTAELAAENQTWDAETWRTGGYEGTSLLQMVDGWNDEQSALVVAGHSAEDTRTAAEFLANYGDHSDALSGESQVQISTETGNVVE